MARKSLLHGCPSYTSHDVSDPNRTHITPQPHSKQQPMLTSLYSCSDNGCGVYFLQLHAVQIDPYSLCLLEELRMDNLLSYSLTCILYDTKLRNLFGSTLLCAWQVCVCVKRVSRSFYYLLVLCPL